MDDARREKLERRIAAEWAKSDPEARVVARSREDGKLDVTVISRLFEEQDSQAREALLWPVFRDVPPEEMMQMTYCLLLTPDEAARYFRAPQAEPAQEDSE